jgi:hypothetical protein
MKKIFLLIFITFAGINIAFSQEKKEKKVNHEQKYKDFLEKAGYKNIKIATLSKGKYQEFHDLDSIVQIGSTFINVNSRKIVGFVKNDTLNQRNNVSVPSRWMSIDPLAHEFYSHSPYNFCLNNPISPLLVFRKM